MTTFVFFKKGSQLFALDKTDTEKASRLKAKGYEKQFEEIDAAGADQALTRYADIKKEEEIAPFAWASGAIFSGAIVVVLALAGYFFSQ
ncbi:hypothetical protein SNQ22_003667 [Cronobacter universalis]|uniref:Uncharacterized protein n=1 Tax=Cronobacter universalis NCTC 9529 TaxID=1074000 RepID=A0AAC8VUB1_9ENTR|nr:hypothetical protein [Cronobacter universalis]ALB57045.1 hypothetical protein AFK65_20295 [Cronobacter universalis NCTC 9529]ELY3468692.1 hypothetical protein [Cronobacter universalis]ELY6247255.1 hypothetical protein [Cronobacter universalis]ELY7393617.1 hypothetical protein [Cronobacter universalis]CCK17487.1 hypothetical protein BN136_3497 [Cronobacter universalis NCTC 9529]